MTFIEIGIWPQARGLEGQEQVTAQPLCPSESAAGFSAVPPAQALSPLWI